MIYDISPPLTPHLPVWPGDMPLSRRVKYDLDRGDPVTLSSFRTTAHLGAHVDAPSHYGPGAPTIDERPLDIFLGPCQVIHVPALPRSAIPLALLREPVQAARVLIATGSYPLGPEFRDDFAGLSPDLVAHLHRQGVILVGIDTPSVDPYAAEDLPAHKAFLRLNMTILEGLVLDHVPNGRYELIALPLKLIGFDASPVRAILRPLPGG